jgi:hypothetical protein
MCHGTQFVPVEFEDGYVVGSAEARRTSDDDLQHLLKLAWRGTDDPQNLGGCRLLFHGLGKMLPCVGEIILQISNGGGSARGR